MADLKANSARPSALNSPVPGADGAAALNAFLSQQAQPSPADAAGAKALDTELAQQNPPEPPPPPPEQPGAVMQGLQAGAKVLDYPGGLVRTGLAEVAGLATGKLDTVKIEDVMNALKGKAPNSAEYLKRLGVSEGGRINIPFLGSVPARSIEGVALDIATDPLSAISKLVKEVPYIGKLINAPGAASEAAGEAIYRSGLKKVDAKMIERGGAPISEALLESGAPVGTTQQLMEHVKNLSDTMGQTRQGLYDKAAELGAAVDLTQPLKRAEAVIERMMRNPPMKAAALELQTMLNSYKEMGVATLDLVSEWKTSLNDALPASAFGSTGRLKGSAMQLKQALAADFRDAIVATGNKAEKGLGDGIERINARWGTLLNAAKPMGQQAKSAAGASLGGTIDTLLLASGHVPVAIAKKGMDLANTTYARTAFGKALIAAGQSGIANTLASRAAIEPGVAQRPSPMQPPPPAEEPQ